MANEMVKNSGETLGRVEDFYFEISLKNSHFISITRISAVFSRRYARAISFTLINLMQKLLTSEFRRHSISMQ